MLSGFIGREKKRANVIMEAESLSTGRAAELIIERTERETAIDDFAV
jgi:hypothetical protein